MRSGPQVNVITPSATSVIEPPRLTLRLKLKPKAPATGYVDGAWWPRSLDLSAELPALLAVLAVRLGRIHRVSYNLNAWDTALRYLPVEGGLVRLGGFNFQNPHTMDVFGSEGPPATLLVVPPETDEAAAHQMLMTAARRGNLDTVDELIKSVAGGPVAPGTGSLEVSVDRWEADGGRPHTRA
jgi:hypothetical protein